MPRLIILTLSILLNCIFAFASPFSFSFDEATGEATLLSAEKSLSKAVMIPDSVENGGRYYAVTKIAKQAFAKCGKIETVKLPSELKIIGPTAFAECSKLKSIVIPDGVDVIPHHCFFFCASLESVTLPSSLKSIEHDAFIACRSLQTIYIPKSVHHIGSWAFGENLALKSVDFESGNNKLSIGDHAFDRSGLETLVIPSFVDSLGEYMFNGCSSLKSVVVEANLDTLPKMTFH
ncbi:MAG: leucine-rich repeat protein, partial [Paludibacteraceae bacterium]|nr:leucine-rich repeat protein [Paludibacteraceae bacterium]